MWMLSAGVRVRAGGVHGRMGRYGAAAPGAGMAIPMMPPMSAGTDSMPGESHQMMQTMQMQHATAATNKCTL
jgi:hypothetical protein